jgi:cell surface protein SprA
MVLKELQLSWYSIDLYYIKPSGITNDDLSLNTTRRILSELYPLTDIAQGQSQVINTLNVSYYLKIVDLIII